MIIDFTIIPTIRERGQDITGKTYYKCNISYPDMQLFKFILKFHDVPFAAFNIFRKKRTNKNIVEALK